MPHWSKKALLPLISLFLLAAAAPGDAADKIARGKVLYLQYCASCHGIDGDGKGPLAKALSTPPANLCKLSERYGNPLPEAQIARFIDGRSDVKAHGPRDMPVWGERFYAETQGNEKAVRKLISELTAYLQSIQIGARTASRN